MTNEHIPDQVKELIQNEIDGLNSSEQSDDLAQLLKTDAAARQAFDELSIVQSAFESLPEVIPPGHLRTAIMESLPEMGYGTVREASRDQSHMSVWASIQQLVMNPRPVSLAYAFSIGILVSFLAWNVVMMPSTGPVDPALVGTMASSGPPVVYEQPISGDLDVGRISARVRNGQVRVEVKWTGEMPASFRVAYNPVELFATGVERVMGQSSLATMGSSDAELTYVVAGASLDIVTLIPVSGATVDLVSVVDVWVSAEGMIPVQHRIPVQDVE
jgi:hypothetical protein